MSKETSEWLNQRTLIGFTSKRGNAWHYREDSQGGEPNHYEDAIPVGDVTRRLFDWAPAEGTITTTYTDANGNKDFIVDPERKAIIRPAKAFGEEDPGAILGVFKSGYTVHGYEQWLLDNVGTILDDGLSIGSAGLLKGGAVAWVQVEVPETITTPEGVAFRPFLSAATSLDGSLSSTYQVGAQVIVCDNTLSAALGDKESSRIKVKHSRKSLGKIGEVRDALGIVYAVGEDFAEQVAALSQVKVTPKQWGSFVDLLVPRPEDAGRGQTLADNKRDTIKGLYANDLRVAPWAGTAFGVVQAVNTFTHHSGIVRGGTHAERNALRAVTGGADALDQGTLDLLNKVLVSA